MQTEWQSQISNLKVQILCPNGDWSDGTFVGISGGMVNTINVLIIFFKIYNLHYIIAPYLVDLYIYIIIILYGYNIANI